MMHMSMTAIYILFGVLILLLIGVTFAVRIFAGHQVESDHPRTPPVD